MYTIPKAMLFLLLLTTFLIISIDTASAESITIVADDWCPYNCEPESDDPGYIVEIAQELFQEAGYNVKYEYLSWLRAIKEVTKGTYAGAIGATPEEMPDGIFPDEEFGYYADYFIVREDETWVFTGIESLTTIRLGAIKGYNYGDEINRYIESNSSSMAAQVLTGNSAVNRNLSKLMQNKIDAYIEDKSVAFYTANKMGITDQIKIGGSKIEPIPLYIGFSPALTESKTYAEIISNGIRTMRESGRLAEILEKYGVEDWK